MIQRDVAAENYEAAKDAFNQVRQIDPKSKYGERALFAVALNYYNQQDYEKIGGLTNNAGTGKDGAITFTTSDASSGDAYSITLEMVKHYVNPYDTL